MSANIIRYFPGGKTVVIGIKPFDARPVMLYTRGNPKFGSCVNLQSKNAKETLPVSCCLVKQLKTWR
jgi:hypothetical protein